MEPGFTADGSPVIDRLLDYALTTVPERADLKESLSHYYAHVDQVDFDGRRTEDLFGMAVDHLALAESWEPGAMAIDVADPRVEVDGWGSGHTVVLIVTDDMPFLVDSVTMELSRLGIGIHFIVHPVMAFTAGPKPVVGPPQAGVAHDHLLSLISVEIDRQVRDDRDTLDANLRRVLGDVAAVVHDWKPMRARMEEVSASLDPDRLPIDAADVAETRQFLDWLVDDHYLLLGARDYELGLVDDVEVLRIVPRSGLGILAGDNHLGHPRPLSEMQPEARERVKEKRLLNLTKAGSRATVHRPSYLDYVGIKTFNDQGEVIGERRFLGLFTSDVYNAGVSDIPRVRHTVAEVLTRTSYAAGGHDEKRLQAILERYPRDEVLQMDVDELYDVAVAINGLQERRRVRVFARTELFGRFVTVLVFLPRDRYNTSTRSGIEEVLAEAYGGYLADWQAQMTESVLARLQFVLRINTSTNEVEVGEVEAAIEQLIAVWDDGFASALIGQFGEDEAVRLGRRYGAAFGPDYQRAFEPRLAAADVGHLQALEEPGSLRLSVYREPGRPADAFKLKLYRRGAQVSLTSVMPTLTNLGVTVVDEWPYEVRPADGDTVWIYDFALEHGGTELDFTTVSDLVAQAFSAAWSGRVDDDGFNRLVLAAGLAIDDVAVLRAYARYLHQARIGYSPSFIEQTLVDHPDVARLLFDLFAARFEPVAEAAGGLESEFGGQANPDHDPDPGAESAEQIEARLLGAIDTISSLDHDRILRRFHNLIVATLRTSWAQRGEHGEPRPYLAMKFDSTIIDELPEPRPEFEIFVYAPRFEGVHLRGGAVARGGLRWSDRSEDYRTEVLGLVKAQMVKNAVIVPAGAKGGFVIKRPPAASVDLRPEVEGCYRLFVSALLALTDNLVEGEVVPPPRTRRYDGDDSYLVVAADKGTATFSDLANAVSQQQGFWLGDAFASGGSQGYDHKAMGITARGAWESVRRHFRELGLNVDSEPFTTVGIGDMSGDVFGNGMLRSPFTRLVAAFDHRHIFIDPDPDPAVGFEERQRLFDLPRSRWIDYNPALVSQGGGVYERTAKSIDLSPEARRALGTDVASATPEELISIVLRAPVDLLWNGGIGTYIKASTESNADVGDKANDRIRVNGRDLRCSVVGEGGNLGVTQQGRIEIAKAGRRIFTDAIDNAGGVDTSDREVNIKILLDTIVADGELTSKQRNELLESMTEEIGDLVIENSHRQALALSVARVDAPSLIDVHARYLDELESSGLLDRSIEALPDGEELGDRRLAGVGLTTPELSVLSAYAKNILGDRLIASDGPDSPVLLPLLINYFPTQLQERFGSSIGQHRLRREIIANRLANLVVDRAGISMTYRLSQELSSPPAEIAAAHFAAWEIYDLEAVVGATNDLEGTLGVQRQLGILLAGRQLAERATRLLLRNRPHPFDPAAAIEDLAAPVRQTVATMAGDLVGADRRFYDSEVEELMASGAPPELAHRAAVLPAAVAALDIVAVAGESGVELGDVSSAYFALAEGLDLIWLRDQILALPRDSQWSTLARLTLRADLYTDHRELTAQVLAVTPSELDPASRVEQWVGRHRSEVDRYRQVMLAIRSTTGDVTSLLVAAREVRNLIIRTRPAEA